MSEKRIILDGSTSYYYVSTDNQRVINFLKGKEITPDNPLFLADRGTVPTKNKVEAKSVMAKVTVDLNHFVLGDLLTRFEDCTKIYIDDPSRTIPSTEPLYKPTYCLSKDEPMSALIVVDGNLCTIYACSHPQKRHSYTRLQELCQEENSPAIRARNIDSFQYTLRVAGHPVGTFDHQEDAINMSVQYRELGVHELIQDKYKHCRAVFVGDNSDYNVDEVKRKLYSPTVVDLCNTTMNPDSFKTGITLEDGIFSYRGISLIKFKDKFVVVVQQDAHKKISIESTIRDAKLNKVTYTEWVSKNIDGEYCKPLQYFWTKTFDSKHHPEIIVTYDPDTRVGISYPRGKDGEECKFSVGTFHDIDSVNCGIFFENVMVGTLIASMSPDGIMTLRYMNQEATEAKNGFKDITSSFSGDGSYHIIVRADLKMRALYKELSVLRKAEEKNMEVF